MKKGAADLMWMAAVCFLLGTLFLPLLGEAGPAIVQTTGSNGFALAIEEHRGALSLSNAAEIFVLVINPLDGTPLAGLGDNVGGGYDVITLPPGWTLQGLAGPFWCGGLRPIQFENFGDGTYRIKVAPSTWFFCGGWLKGDYVYRIEINNPAGSSFQGSALGVFTVTGRIE